MGLLWPPCIPPTLRVEAWVGMWGYSVAGSAGSEPEVACQPAWIVSGVLVGVPVCVWRFLFLRYRTSSLTGRRLTGGASGCDGPPRRSVGYGSLLDRSGLLRRPVRPTVRWVLVVLDTAGGEYGTLWGCRGIRCSLVGRVGRILLGLGGLLGGLGLMSLGCVRRVAVSGGRISLCGLWRSVRRVRWCCSVLGPVSGLWGRLRGCRRCVCCRWVLPDLSLPVGT